VDVARGSPGKVRSSRRRQFSCEGEKFQKAAITQQR
jgi:hypothetical protein